MEARTGDVVCVWAYFVGGVLNVFSVYHLKPEINLHWPNGSLIPR